MNNFYENYIKTTNAAIAITAIVLGIGTTAYVISTLSGSTSTTANIPEPPPAAFPEIKQKNSGGTNSSETSPDKTPSPSRSSYKTSSNSWSFPSIISKIR